MVLRAGAKYSSWCGGGGGGVCVGGGGFLQLHVDLNSHVARLHKKFLLVSHR